MTFWDQPGGRVLAASNENLRNKSVGNWNLK